MKLFCRHQPCFEKQCCVGFVFTGVSSVSTLEGKVCFLCLFPTSRAAVQQICVSLIPNVIFQPLVLSVDPFHICCKPWHLHPVAQQ